MGLIKDFVSSLLLPLSLCLEALLVGLVLLWFTQRQKAGKIAVTFGVVGLLLMGNGTFSDWLLWPLEHRYPPIISLRSADIHNRLLAAGYVVVLGGAYVSNPGIPITSQLNENTMDRLAEGIRLYRELPGSRLVVSGGAMDYPVPQAVIMATAAEELGAKPEDIVLESQSRDTPDAARLIKPIVGAKPFLLVTSASHMPRSMALFEKLGMHPIAAPSDYLAKGGGKITFYDFLPALQGVVKTHRAMHEYLGLAWEKLRGQI